ncbi:MAG: hypothetical protein FWH07_07500 [Oscillospiraceae bacterium]|nr:hypothetical protein [Oscillospiraceae bacterium]
MKIVNDCYNSIARSQDERFEKIFTDLETETRRLSQKIEVTNKKIWTAIDKASDVSDKMIKSRKIRDLMFYAAPVAVVLDLLFRLYQHFIGA